MSHHFHLNFHKGLLGHNDGIDIWVSGMVCRSGFVDLNFLIVWFVDNRVVGNGVDNGVGLNRLSANITEDGDLGDIVDDNIICFAL